jgi:cytochrome P450/NADPH-cytochrome P450 reductase
MQEAVLVLGLLLQRFEMTDHTGYQLRIAERLTLKPEGFLMKVQPRVAQVPVVSLARPVSQATPSEPELAASTTVAAHHTPLLVLYGSDLGTAEGVANRIAEDGRRSGFDVTAGPLDDYVGAVPPTGAVVVVSSTYNGTPPSNAARFVAWLADPALATDALRGVRYTVFGCGSRDWASTYQRVPSLIDEGLAAHGATRVCTRGEGDSAGDFDGAFQAWYSQLWKALAEALSITMVSPDEAPVGTRYRVEVVLDSATMRAASGFNVVQLTISENRELQAKSGPQTSERSTRHIVLTVPKGVRYTTGDHLGIFPRNDAELVGRVLSRFNFARDTRVRLQVGPGSSTNLPVDVPIAVFDLLSDFVELQEPATRTHIRALAGTTECPPEKQALIALAGEDEASTVRYRIEVLARRRSVLDLLEEFRSCVLPFNAFLEFLPPLRPRYYSISSSPLVDPRTCSITVGVLDVPSRLGTGSYHGVCSGFLARVAPGEHIYAFVHPPSLPFQPPEDAGIPMIMVGAGTGLAPFRGFLQDRAAHRALGTAIGPSLLFFGCRSPEQDFLYGEELQAFDAAGVTRLQPAFSRQLGRPRTYVQDAIRAHSAEVWHLMESGAIIYVCGDAGRIDGPVREAFKAVYEEQQHADEEKSERWMVELAATHRYRVDVWPSGQ